MLNLSRSPIKTVYMLLYSLKTLTLQRFEYGFLDQRLVSKVSAIDDYINETKERFLSLLSSCPDLRDSCVTVKVVRYSLDSSGVFNPCSSIGYAITINSDNSFSVDKF